MSHGVKVTEMLEDEAIMSLRVFTTLCGAISGPLLLRKEEATMAG
jgi:hypothetical protein